MNYCYLLSTSTGTSNKFRVVERWVMQYVNAVIAPYKSDRYFYHSSRLSSSVRCCGDTAQQEMSQQQSKISAMVNIKVLYFSQVPIEPTISAAGVRSQYLLHQIQQQHTATPATSNNTSIHSIHIISPSPTRPSHASSEGTTTCGTTPYENAKDATARVKVQYHTLLPNRSNDTYLLLNELMSPYNTSNKSSDSKGDQDHPSIFYLIIFDRYYSEEMYSFHVYNYFRATNVYDNTNNTNNNFMFLLDMQDMHSLRSTRQKWVKKQDRQLLCSQHGVSDENCYHDVLEQTIPNDDVLPSIYGKDSDMLLRELASIYRCDLTLVCSMYEYNLLVDWYHIPATKLCIAPLFGTTQHEQDHDQMKVQEQNNLSYYDRYDYVFVGGMKHEPNVDAIRQLQRLWPAIRQQFVVQNSNVNSNQATGTEFPVIKQESLPNLYIYGAHCNDHFRSEIHNPSDGIYMEGYYPHHISNVLHNKRVLLSPLRYGAGIKGKHIEAWKCSVPIVTTLIGCEGMIYPNDYNRPTMNKVMAQSEKDTIKFCGCIVHSDMEFVDMAYQLYVNERLYNECISNISKQQLLELCDDWDRIWYNIKSCIYSKTHSNSNGDNTKSNATTTLQQVLWHQSNRSTEYFSKYIECKEQTVEKQK